MKKQKDSEFYTKSYIDNEADANRKMTYANAIAAGVALTIWILYLSGVFTLYMAAQPVIMVVLPVAAIALLIPLFFLKTNAIRHPRYKYVLLFSFLSIISAINVFIPKHGVLGWCLAIVMANHYYNPRFARKIFVSTIIMMLFCTYLGMFFGEYDPLLLDFDSVDEYSLNTFNDRLNYLNDLLAKGNNRYLKAFVLYYLPRTMVISLLFVISNSLNRRTKKLLENEIKVNGEQEKIKAELNVAKDIQISTLPIDRINDGVVEIKGELTAAKEVGGDLYDYLYIDENHVAVLIGDVSGKGVPAAMFMMKTITSFRDYAIPNKTPSQILKDINSSIMKGNKAGMFVTCFLAIIDKRNGKTVYSNAGHNPPIIGDNKAFKYLKPNHGLLLGAFSNPPLKDEEIVLKPGEHLFLYTDGVTEARNDSGDFYSEQRLIESFNKQAYTSIDELHNSLQKDVIEFVNGAEQSDDITIVTLKYCGGSNK